MRISLLITLLMTLFNPAFADSSEDEYHHKAEIIVKLVKMVGWPANSIAKENFTICIYGNIPYMKQMKTIEAAKLDDHKVKLKKIDNIDDPNLGCNLIYLYDVSESEQDKVIQKFYKKPVLLLGDMDSFAMRGGSMNFTHINKTLAVTVNMETLKKSNLLLDLHKVEEITVIPEKKELMR